MPIRFLLICSMVTSTVASVASAQSYVQRGEDPLYTEYLDPSFPFVEVTLDLRGAGAAKDPENLVPRAIVLPLGNQVFIGFDTELLRVAAIWQGDFVTPDSLAMLSYPHPRDKAPLGQGKLPRPNGPLAVTTGLHPGWLDANHPTFIDPRPRWLDQTELGRGPLSAAAGRWQGIDVSGADPILHYSLRGGTVTEQFKASQKGDDVVVERRIQFRGTGGDILLALADFGADTSEARNVAQSSAGVELRDGHHLVAAVAATAEGFERIVRYRISAPGTLVGVEVTTGEGQPERRVEPARTARWPNEQQMTFGEPAAPGDYALEYLELAYPNAWQRRIRPTDMLFEESGAAVVVTFDGDVYRVKGLATGTPSWHRIASGFNEPQSVAQRDGELFVFSRGGVTRLVDRNGDGETDFYAMFCNDFTQSGETRDMPMSLTTLADGSFLICKGGQQVDSLSPHSGRVLKISPDGRKAEIFATGLRNGYVERHPVTGLLTASDQQGNWVPATPLLGITAGKYYGFEQGADDLNQPIQEPLLWIPHRVSQSAIGQIWTQDKGLGDLNDSLLLIDYQGPRLLKILLDQKNLHAQAAVVPLPLRIEVPILKGAIDPADGRLYLVGFQIWGSNALRYEGLCRLSPATPHDRLPQRAVGFREGVLLEFAQPLAETFATDPGSYEAKSWEYLRLAAYGSAQYKADGSFGEDQWRIHSVRLSPDRRRVFLAIEGLQPTMQFALEYNLFGSWDTVYFTFRRLESFDAAEAGFAPVDFAGLFASKPAARTVRREPPLVSVARGRQVYEQFACMGCHSTDGSMAGKIGPTLQDLYWKQRTLANGTITIADESYLRRSIFQPEAEVVAGYGGSDASMPSFRGILTDEDVASITLFIRSLTGSRDAP
jgi:mono/diheme cytochrome c family protein